MISMPFWRRRYFTIVALAFIVVSSSYLITGHLYGTTRPTIAILTTDTRHPYVDLDPTVLLSSWTLTALSNHLYARSIGAQFVYFKIEPPVQKRMTLPKATYRKDMDGYCEHRTLGWRTSHFCKMPFVWWFIQNSDLEKFIYIDSDAMFRHPDIHVDRHFQLLSPTQPFGVLTNRPWGDGVCSGYWFMFRPKPEARGMYDVADFLLDWWNEEWVHDPYYWYDQSTLRRIMGGVAKGNLQGPDRKITYLNQTVIVDEWHFELKTPDQMILHVGSKTPDRDQQLANAWPWGDIYPLDDREQLVELLDEMDIRIGSGGLITSKMPLPGVRSFGRPASGRL